MIAGYFRCESINGVIHEKSRDFYVKIKEVHGHKRRMNIFLEGEGNENFGESKKRNPWNVSISPFSPSSLDDVFTVLVPESIRRFVLQKKEERKKVLIRIKGLFFSI